MRRWFLLLALCLPAAPQEVEEFYSRLIKFDRSYQALVHSACGWPEKIEEATLNPVCRPADGHFNLKSYTEARNAAKHLFGLRD